MHTATRLMFGLLISLAPLTPTYSQSGNTTHYVSIFGNNQDGATWKTAWNELDQIEWDQVQAGDTIVIDGASGKLIYSTSLDIQKSGTSENPIRIKRASEPGRDGQVIIFGGRVDPLPYCFQQDYAYQEDVLDFGIRTNNNSFIEIDGLKWGGIVIHGFERSGVRMDHNDHDISIRNVEIYNNGYANLKEDGWVPNGVGIRLAGYNVLLERNIIHDNGQDAIQGIWGDSNIRNLRISQSWLHNERQHPTHAESWNYCTHTDGLQIYDGGVVFGITIEESVIGPGFTNNLILGQSTTSNGSKVDVQSVIIRNTLLMKPADNNVFGYQDTDTQNWTIDHVTAHCPSTKWHCLHVNNDTHAVRNSIVYGSRITFEGGISDYRNNCTWETEGADIGINADPMFVGVSDRDMFSLDDYALRDGSQCTGMGSSITSVQKLLNLGNEAPPIPPEPCGEAVRDIFGTSDIAPPTPPKDPVEKVYVPLNP